MKNSSNKVTANLHPGSMFLFVLWLLIAILPGITLNFMLDRIVSESENLVKNEARQNLLNEMDEFRFDLQTANFLNRKLIDFSNKNGFIDFEKSVKNINYYQSLTAEKLRQMIKKETGLSPAIVFFHGPDTFQCTTSVNPKYKKFFPLVSNKMTQNLFWILNKQHLAKPIAFNSIKQKVKKLENSKTHETFLNRSYQFINMLFSIAGYFRLSPRNVNSAISGKTGLSKLRFFYSPATCNNRNNNLGGFICVFSDKDLKAIDIFQSAKKASETNIFSRKFSFTHFKSFKSFNYFKKQVLGFHENDKVITLKEIISPEMMVKLSTRDTFYPSQLMELKNKFPVLEVSLNKKNLAHPLRDSLEKAKFAFFLGCLIISIFFIHLNFFGIQSNLKFKTKFFLALTAASLLPFVGMALLNSFHKQNLRVHHINSTIQNLKLKTEQLKKSISSFNTKLESENHKLTTRLAKYVELKDLPILRSAIQKWIKDKPTISITTNFLGEEFILGEDIHEIPEFDKQLKDFLFAGVYNTFGKTHKKGQKPKSGLVELNNKGMGSFLTGMGTLKTHETSSFNTLYSLMASFPFNDKFKPPTCTILAKFSTRKILQQFLALESEFITPTEIHGFKIEKCFIPLDRSDELPDLQSFISTKNFDKSKIISKATLLLNDRSDMVWKEISSGTLKIYKGSYISNLHTIEIVSATEIKATDFTILPPGWILTTYFIALFVVVLKLVESSFLIPIKNFSKAAAEVGKGNLDYNIELTTNDEFADLGQAFNHMTNGLKQKEMLSSFVSSDVLEAVKGNSNESLKPGGELKFVSVVFVALKGFKETENQREPEQSLKILNTFMEAVHSCCEPFGGIIDKIIDDTIMIIFRNDGNHQDQCVIRASKVALSISAKLKTEIPEFQPVCGLASGEAVSGKIGSLAGKLNFTVIGNPVNLSARLKAKAHLAKNTGIIICPASIRLTKGKVKLNFIDRISIKGRTRTFPLYELASIRD